MRDVYINGEGLVSLYRSLKRYSVDENSVTGKYDLLISNATFDDAGYYICSEPKGNDDPPHARLLVSGKAAQVMAQTISLVLPLLSLDPRFAFAAFLSTSRLG